jgi:hypothetical protein
MIRSMLSVVALVSALALASPVYSDGKGEKDPNPRKDKDVQQGYDDYKRNYRQKDVKDHYEVKTSNDGHIVQTEPTAAPKK